jgi:hypothetical protein
MYCRHLYRGGTYSAREEVRARLFEAQEGELGEGMRGLARANEAEGFIGAHAKNLDLLMFV